MVVLVLIDVNCNKNVIPAVCLPQVCTANAPESREKHVDI